MKAIFTSILICTALKLTGQVFPVSIIAFENSSLSPQQISDLIGNTEPYLNLQLTLDDLQANQHFVEISLELIGPGITIKSSSKDQNIQLLSGIAYTSTSKDWAQWLDINNMVVSGVNSSDFLESGQFPEGFYQLNINAKNPENQHYPRPYY